MLLIDEVDRADEAFEAYLLELLSDFQISIPELGTVQARAIPLVVITSNGTRELSDALRRRCLYQYIDYPNEDAELRIVLARGRASAGPGAADRPLRAGVRRRTCGRSPASPRRLDWTAALLGLGIKDLRDDPEALHDTLALPAQDPRGSRAMPADMTGGWRASSATMMRLRGLRRRPSVPPARRMRIGVRPAAARQWLPLGLGETRDAGTALAPSTCPARPAPRQGSPLLCGSPRRLARYDELFDASGSAAVAIGSRGPSGTRRPAPPRAARTLWSARPEPPASAPSVSRPARATGLTRPGRRGGASAARASPRRTCATSTIPRSSRGSMRWPSGWRAGCAIACRGASAPAARPPARPARHHPPQHRHRRHADPAGRAAAARPPLRLVVLLDISGSMSQYAGSSSASSAASGRLPPTPTPFLPHQADPRRRPCASATWRAPSTGCR